MLKSPSNKNGTSKTSKNSSVIKQTKANINLSEFYLFVKIVLTKEKKKRYPWIKKAVKTNSLSKPETDHLHRTIVTQEKELNKKNI